MKAATRAEAVSQELAFRRRFCRDGVAPFDAVAWEKRDATIRDQRGNVIFQQKGVEVPAGWSQSATNIAVSKYFRGQLGTPARESSVRQMVGRVASTIARWGREGRYFEGADEAGAFEDELTHILVNQMAAFNSPVFFNMGIDPKPQSSACQPYHALVSTAEGLVPIGEIVEKNRVGLPVFDGEGLTQIVAVKNNGRKQVYRIQLNDGFFVEATADHVVCAHGIRRTQTLEWKRVDGLKPGMHMRIYPRSAAVTAPASPQQVSEAALAGWLQADGFVGQYSHGTNQSLTAEFITVNDEEHAWVQGHLDVVFPHDHRKVREFETKNKELKGRCVRLYGECLRPFVEKYGLLARGLEMRVPTAIWASPRQAVAAYLKSLFQSEGYATIHGESAQVALAMISRKLVEDAQVLLTRLGIYSRVRQKLEARPDRHNMFELNISVQSEREKFLNAVGFVDSRKNGLLSQSVMLHGKDCPEIRYPEIVSIEPLGEMEVFDIQTQSGKYLSNAVLVHNCFINSVKDDMRSILQLVATEGMLFKYGSGTGSNLSTLRSSRETLSFSSGKASGPVSFMKAFDTMAGVIKSGGKTRRAAKMVILNADHPDIVEFINCKAIEEKKAWALIEAGYDGAVDGEAYGSVAFQNANHSVRATDEFMTAVAEDRDWSTKAVTTGATVDTHKAREIMRMICESTYICGDPGMQFDTTINRWHTIPNSGRINASNPCVTGDTRVLTAQGRWHRIDSMVGKPTELVTNVAGLASGYTPGSFKTGTKPIYRLETRAGYWIKLTADHKVFTPNRGFVPAAELTKDDLVQLPAQAVADVLPLPDGDEKFFQLVGLYLGDGCHSQNAIQLTMDKELDLPVLEAIAGHVSSSYEKICYRGQALQVHRTPTSGRLTIVAKSAVSKVGQFVDFTQKAHEKAVSEAVFGLTLSEQRCVLQGLFTADGTVANYGEKSQYVSLDSTSLKLLKGVQVMLTGFGIKSRIYENRRAGKLASLLPDGKGGVKEYAVLEMHSLRVSRSSRLQFEKLVGFMAESYKAEALHKMNEEVETYLDSPYDYVKSLEYAGEEDVYDLTEPISNSFIVNGITVHNCSEYMSIDDSACNLASLNLMKFRTTDGKFDAESFKHAISVMITAMEIIVGNSSYPTEPITRNAKDFRQLGLGYANLGALLMANGIAYDSDEGRNTAAMITALMSGSAYKCSALAAKKLGAFARYKENEEPFLRVIGMHRNAAYQASAKGVPGELVAAARTAWDEALDLGREYGYRNSQISVLAPTGTIGFLMDCDTTGVEPDIALVKYKWLVGGGMMKIVNGTVPEALEKLGYGEAQRKEILAHIGENDTIEGAPHLKEEHLPVFDCAFRPKKGKRSIHYMGHVRMMAAVQPFISGAISKTVNMPNEATSEEIMNAYAESWKMGLKAIAIYRDGSKRTQPLTTALEQKNADKTAATVYKPVRRRLADERRSITHKFSVNNYEGYITVGMFEDGTPGEIFITMSKEGSTISGFTDAFATSLSMALQYGVPLRVLASKFVNARFEPAGFTHNPEIRTASSVLDYISRWLSLKFLSDDELSELGMKRRKGATTVSEQLLKGDWLPAATEKHPEQPAREAQEPQHAAHEESRMEGGISASKITFEGQMDAPPCRECGSIMVRNAACYKCLNCGSTSGCS
ncbi:MAG: LAGLIDADG family homing endonuclease [Candidatus Micrarchaeota archaeon]